MSGASTVRAFVAMEMPERVRETIRREQRRLKSELPRARWTRPEGQHLTLKFLGKMPAHRVNSVAQSIGAAVKGRSALTVGLGGSGFFPSPRRPRVAWVGGRANGGAELAAAVDAAASTEGFPAERRAWTLHLTLARLDRGWPRSAVERFLEWGRNLDLEEFVCPEIVLFSSELRPGGAVYTPLERFPLE